VDKNTTPPNLPLSGEGKFRNPPDKGDLGGCIIFSVVIDWKHVTNIPTQKEEKSQISWISS